MANAEVAKLLKQSHEEYVAAATANNVDGILKLVSDRAVYHSPVEGIVTGKEKIGQALKETLNRLRVHSLQLKSQHTQEIGDTIIDHGAIHQVLVDKKGENVNADGSYSMVWQNTGHGLLLVSATWHGAPNSALLRPAGCAA